MVEQSGYLLARCFVLTFLACLLTLPSHVLSKKVLMLSPQVGSHLMQTNSVAEGLIARGHKVYTIMDVRARIPKNIMHPQVRTIHYDTGEVPTFQNPIFQKYLETEFADWTYYQRFQVTQNVAKCFHDECNRILRNKALSDALLAEKFDIVVNNAVMRCFAIIPHRLGIPFVSFMAFLPMDIPHVSLQGHMLVRGPMDDLFSDTDNLFTRVARISLITVYLSLMGGFDGYSAGFVRDLQKDSLLWLIDNSRLFDTPIPVSPNVIYVGGLNVRKPQAIADRNLKQFVDSATEGFIFMSFGSVNKRLPDKMINTFIEVFKESPYKIVWKLNTNNLKTEQVLPKNVLALNWLPQNDVLGHPNIKLFITHCGNSGQHEALYNSVPMLGIPLFGDQVFNAKRLEKRWFGVYIRVRDITKQRIIDAIKQVITDRSFAESVEAASKIFRDQPMEPRDTAAYWIDHVMKYGADHLRSSTNDLSWFQILMYDVLFVVITVIIVVCSLFFLTFRCICRLCRRDKDRKKKDQ